MGANKQIERRESGSQNSTPTHGSSSLMYTEMKQINDDDDSYRDQKREDVEQEEGFLAKTSDSINSRRKSHLKPQGKRVDTLSPQNNNSNHDQDLETERSQSIDLNMQDVDLQGRDADNLLTNIHHRWWVRMAIIASYCSIAVVLAFGIAGLVLSGEDHSDSLLIYGLEQLLDVATSFILLWRFRGFSLEGFSLDVSKYKATNYDSRLQDLREKQTSVLICISFLILGLFTGIKSIVSLADKSMPQSSKDPVIIAAVSIPAFLLLGLSKFYISRHIKSPALLKDAVGTLLSVPMAVGILVSGEIYREHEDLWWIDDCIAMLCAIALILYALKYLVFAGDFSWCSKSFWTRAPLPSYMSEDIMHSGNFNDDEEAIELPEHFGQLGIPKAKTDHQEKELVEISGD